MTDRSRRCYRGAQALGYAAALSVVLTAISLVASVIFIRIRESGDS